MKLYQSIFILFSIFSIAACGGGGGSAASPTNPNNPTPTNPGPGTSSPEPLIPGYSGARNNLIFDDVTIGESVVGVLNTLDFINAILFDEDRGQSFLLPIEETPPYVSEDLRCSSGASETVSNSTNTELEITYSDCVVGQDIINGTTFAFLNASDQIIVNVNLSIRQANETLNIIGSITEINELGSFRVNLLLEQSGEQIWLSNLLVISNPADLLLAYLGDIYFSDKGKITVDTTLAEFNGIIGAYEFTIDMAGQSSVEVFVQINNRLQINSPDLITPLQISLQDFEGLPSENLEPIANIETTNGDVSASAQYNDNIILSAANSSDNNLQPLTYSWTIVEQPPEANVSISSNNANGIVSADRPGDYVIELTVSDPLGATNTTSLPLRFNTRPPEGQLNIAQNSYVYGQQLHADMFVSSPPFDGPFSFSLEYGPNGMQINEDGSIQWEVALPNLGQVLNLNIGVRVTSPDHSLVFASATTATPSQSMKTIPVIEQISRTAVFAQDTSDAVFIDKSTVSKITLNEGIASLAHHPLPQGLESDAVGILAIADTNADESVEYFFAELNTQTNQYTIWSVDENASRQQVYSFDNPSINNFRLAIRIEDIAPTPGKELILSNQDNVDFLHVITRDGQLLSDLVGNNQPWCDIDNDGNTDWIRRDFPTEYRLFDEPQWQSLGLSFDQELARMPYFGPDSDCELFVTELDEGGLANIIAKIDPLSGERFQIVTTEQLLGRPIEFTNIAMLMLMNVDNDDAPELLVNIFDSGIFYNYIIDDIYSENPTWQDIDPNNIHTETSLFSGQSFLLDIDNDNQQEYVLESYQASVGGSRLNVFKVVDNTLQVSTADMSSLPSFFASFEPINTWSESNGSVLVEQSQRVNFSIENQQVVSKELVDLSYQSLTDEEDGQVFEYKQPNQSLVQKLDASGNIIWVLDTPAVGSFGGLFPLSFVNENVLLLSASNSLLISRDDGSVLYRFPEDQLIVKGRNSVYSTIVPAADDVVILSHNVSDIYATRVNNSGEINQLNIPDLLSIHNGQEITAELTQRNDSTDLALALFVDSGGDSQDAYTINFDTLELIELAPSIENNVPRFIPAPYLAVSSCNTGQKNCRNKIAISNLGDTNELTLIHALDVVTLAPVWSTTKPFSELIDIAIAQQDGLISTLLIHEDGVRVLQ